MKFCPAQIKDTFQNSKTKMCILGQIIKINLLFYKKKLLFEWETLFITATINQHTA